MSSQPVTLETERLLLRPWRASDRASFAAMNGDAQVMEYFPSTLTREQSDELVERIESEMELQGYGLWAVEVPGEADFAGFIGLMRLDGQLAFAPGMEIGWRIAQPFWHRGLAQEGARAVLDFAFGEAALAELFSYTAKVNRPSWTLMRRLGMSHDAELDFDHPKVPAGHMLAPHVVYRLRAPSVR